MEIYLYVLMARMEFDDLPIRIFASKESMGHWLQYSRSTFEQDIDAVVNAMMLSRSQLMRVEAWVYRNGELMDIEHVMGFEHLPYGSEGDGDCRDIAV